MLSEKELKERAQAAFGLAARLVQQEPDMEWVNLCITEDLFDECPFGMDDSAVASGLRKLQSWNTTARLNVEEATGDICREWLRLFVGLGSPEAPVWEAVYIEPDATMTGGSTLEVRRIYRKWGLQFERKGSEPDNSLGLMLAFCSYLLGRELEAIGASEGDIAAEAVADLEEVLAQHMLPWVSAWRFLVNEHAKTDYYRGVGDLVFGLERSLAARFGIAFNESDGTFAYREG